MRHHDVRGDPAQARGEREGLGVVARGVGGDAPGGLGVRQGEHRVRGAAELERADALQVLALEEQVRAEAFVEGPGGGDRGAVGVRPDAGGRLPDGREVGRGHGRMTAFTAPVRSLSKRTSNASFTRSRGNRWVTIGAVFTCPEAVRSRAVW